MTFVPFPKKQALTSGKAFCTSDEAINGVKEILDVIFTRSSTWPLHFYFGGWNARGFVVGFALFLFCFVKDQHKFAQKFRSRNFSNIWISVVLLSGAKLMSRAWVLDSFDLYLPSWLIIINNFLTAVNIPLINRKIRDCWTVLGIPLITELATSA